MIEVERVDYIRVPAADMREASHFYGDVLGLERNPNSPDEDWVEYEVGNVTLAVMTLHTHDYEVTPLPPATIALPPRRRLGLSVNLARSRDARALGASSSGRFGSSFAASSAVPGAAAAP